MFSEDVFELKDKGRLSYHSSYTWFEQTILLHFEGFDTVLLEKEEKKKREKGCSWNFYKDVILYCILEWVAFPFSRVSSQPRDQTQVSRIAGGFFTSWVTGKPIYCIQHVHFLYNYINYTCYIYNHYTCLCVYLCIYV